MDLGEQDNASLTPRLAGKPFKGGSRALNGPKVISLKQRYKKSDFQLESFEPD